MIGDIVGTESAIHKLEQLEPSKESILLELENLANLKKFFSQSKWALSQNKYYKVIFSTMNFLPKSIAYFKSIFKYFFSGHRLYESLL